MIKAVIFDLNGIFIKSSEMSESERFKKDFNIPIQEFRSKLEGVLEKIRQPNAESFYHYWQPIFKEWKVGMSEQEFLDYIYGAEKASEVMVDFAKKLKSKGKKVFFLSNSLKEAAKYYYAHFPWMREVADKSYFSFQTGFKKPDARAWENILSDNNLQPEECIYFDDQEKHIKGCESTGIKSFLFTNEKDFRSQIKDLLHISESETYQETA